MTETPSENQVISWFDDLSNWGRWGTEDMLGTLNLVTPAKRLEAVSLVTEGIVISCSFTIGYEPTAEAMKVPQHFMVRTGESPPAPGSRGRTSLGDHITFNVHGATVTHLDAPSHSLWRSDSSKPRTMYNGFPDTLVDSQGAKAGSIEVAGSGIVTRGVLLDLAGLLGVPGLEPGTVISPEELEAAEVRQGVRVTAGDALVVRTGFCELKENHNSSEVRAGLGAQCLPWLRSRDVALVTTDTTNDVHPMQHPELGSPIHGVGMVGMGLWLMDKVNPEELLEVCQRLGRWEFMFVVAPLKWRNGTGSPVNPLALL